MVSFTPRGLSGVLDSAWAQWCVLDSEEWLVLKKKLKILLYGLGMLTLPAALKNVI